MNCTRLSDMSERLTTLEAKVRWSGDPGPRELEREELASAPGSPAGLSSLVPRGGCYLGPQWLWVIFSRLGQPPGVGEGSGMSKKLEGPRQQAGLGVGLSGLSSGRLEAQMLTPRWKEEGSRCPPQGCWSPLRLLLPGLARGWAQEQMEEEPPGTCELSPRLHQGAEGWSNSPQRQRGSVKPSHSSESGPRQQRQGGQDSEKGRMCEVQVCRGSCPVGTPGALSLLVPRRQCRARLGPAWPSLGRASARRSPSPRAPCGQAPPPSPGKQARGDWLEGLGLAEASSGLRLLYLQPPRSLWGQWNCRVLLAQGIASTGRLD